MVDRSSKYRKNLNKWRKTYPYRRKKPNRITITGPTASEDITYDLNTLIKDNNPYQIEKKPLEEAPPFTPLAIENCYELCLADDENITGDPVSDLVNLVPDGIDFEQSTESKKPDRITINGKTWLEFTAADVQELVSVSSVDLTDTDSVTLVLPIRFKSGGTQGTFLGRNSANNSSYQIYISAINKIVGHARGDVGTNNAATSVLSIDTTYIITAVIDFSAGSGISGDEITSLLVDNISDHNGAGTANNTSTNFGSYNNRIGERGGGATPLNGYYRGHSAHKGSLTTAQLTALYDYWAEQV